MTNIDPGYYCYVLCVKCRKEIVLKEANDPNEEAFPKAQSQRVACPNIGQARCNLARSIVSEKETPARGGRRGVSVTWAKVAD
jgi:hypothetical protein